MNTHTPTVTEWETHLSELEIDQLNGRRLLNLPENRLLAPLVKPGMNIMEAGCGNGRYVFAFAMAGATAIGIDFSQRLVNRVRQVAKRLQLDNAFALTGDIMNLPLQDNVFDLYTSFGVYEHFLQAQHKVMFAEAFRVLRPGGLVYIEVPQFWSLWTIRRQLRYWFRRCVPPSMVWQRNMRRKYLIKQAELAGFQTVESHILDAWYGFEKGFSLDCRSLKGVANPFYALRPFFNKFASFCDEREWLGHTLVYIGRKPGRPDLMMNINQIKRWNT